jgi:hypothetical protein
MPKFELMPSCPCLLKMFTFQIFNRLKCSPQTTPPSSPQIYVFRGGKPKQKRPPHITRGGRLKSHNKKINWRETSPPQTYTHIVPVGDTPSYKITYII